MEQLPDEIEDLILEYKRDIENCESRIQEALRMFLNIQASGYYVRSEIINVRGACQAWRAVSKIIDEAQRVIDIIIDEEITPQQIKKLVVLQRALDDSMVHAVILESLEPFTESESNPTNYYHTEHNVPPILF